MEEDYKLSEAALKEMEAFNAMATASEVEYQIRARKKANAEMEARANH